MGRPRKLDALTVNISARIRTDQDEWLRWMADQRHEGELSRTVRWAIDQAQILDFLLRQDDPVEAMDRFLHEPRHPEEEVIEAERELEAWKREQLLKRAQRKARESA